MFNKLALQHAMLDGNCSARDLAQACKISPSAFYRRMNNEVPFNISEIDSCVSRLQLTPESRDKIFFAAEVT